MRVPVRNRAGAGSLRVLEALIVAVIAGLVGAGIASFGCATVFEEGSRDWEQMMHVGDALCLGAVGVGIPCSLWMRSRPR